MNRFAISMVILLILVYIIYTTNGDAEIKVFRYIHNDGPIICLIGSVHGDEPIGTIVLNNLIKSDYFNKINHNCIVIPEPNIHGLKANKREAWTRDMGWFDINRSYDTNNKINNLLKDISHESDLVIELHEGWGFHKINSNSLGSSILPTSGYNEEILSQNIIDNLNSTISDKQKYFTLTKNDACVVKNSLSCYCETNKIRHILVEITGQKNIQPLKLRFNQVLIILNTIFNL